MKCYNCNTTGSIYPGPHGICSVCDGRGHLGYSPWPFLGVLFLVVCASFLAWHVVHWVALMNHWPEPELIAWVLAAPIGVWLVFKE